MSGHDELLRVREAGSIPGECGCRNLITSAPREEEAVESGSRVEQGALGQVPPHVLVGVALLLQKMPESRAQNA